MTTLRNPPGPAPEPHRDGPTEPSPVRAGEVLAGKYVVERVLGAGGMGVVVAARHTQLDERVALKFLLPQHVASEEVVARFVREGRAAAKIRSEHVARVTDVGVLDTGAPFLVMEYLDGTDLSALVHRHGPLPVPDAVDYVLQACEAIAEAHALGIIHRDLKPANLFLTTRADGSRCVKVLDFGISKLTAVDGGRSDTGMTKTTSSLGSPLYMSPEQMTSARSVDARTDVWALGVVLFELLTGSVPFVAESLPHLCILIATAPPVPLRALRHDAPPALEAIVGRCLAKERGARYANVAELAWELGAFGHAHSRTSVERIARTLKSTPPGPSAAPGATQPLPPPPHALTSGSWGTTSAPDATPRSARAVLLGALAFVAAALLIGFGILRDRAGDAHVVAAADAQLTSTSSSPSPPPPPSSDPPASTLASLPIAAPVLVPIVEAGAPPEPPPHRRASTARPPSAPTSAPAAAPPPALPPATSRPAPACDPPFTLDDQGRKHFKPECYLTPSGGKP